jgi:uncharacterized protein (TIGR02147 family)
MGIKQIDLIDSELSTKVLSVYGYTDYRKYLKEFYNFRKGSNKGYSYRSFSKSAGFSSPNILKLVTDGKRNISTQACQKFIRALGLKKQMASYFETLVRMNQSKSDEDKEYFLAILKKLIPQSKKRDLNSESLKYLSEWLNPVIRDMVQLKDFREDPYWISRRLHSKTNLQEITKALHFLKSEGFLTTDENDRLVANDNMVLTSDEIKNLAIRNYHRQMQKQALEALENVPMEEREFGALTIILPDEASDELKHKLKSFRQEIHKWSMQVAEESGGDQVVQLNFQMYPHTKKVSA